MADDLNDQDRAAARTIADEMTSGDVEVSLSEPVAGPSMFNVSVDYGSYTTDVLLSDGDPETWEGLIDSAIDTLREEASG